jgi:hypothetical protein
MQLSPAQYVHHVFGTCGPFIFALVVVTDVFEQELSGIEGSDDCWGEGDIVHPIYRWFLFNV